MLRLISLTAIILSLAIHDICCAANGVYNDGTFNCTDGTIIDYMNLCDDKKNCPDGSDEFLWNDVTKSSCEKQRCPNGYFKCNYGACIQINFMCDGRSDCADGSDEWKYYCMEH